MSSGQEIYNNDYEVVKYLPNHVFALGESGRQLVYGLMKPNEEGDNWFLRDLMREESSIDQFEAHLMDSATDEINEIQSDVEEITDAIDELKPEPAGGRTIPDVEYINFVENSNYRNKDDLLAETNVADITDGEFDHWWLTPDDIRSDPEFESGVVRRRAVSKALYHASKTSSDRIDDAIASVGDGSRIAITVGIGGGTGSGTAIELARDIYERNNNISVTLFVVTPHLEENNKPKANALAALSELEYLALSESDEPTPFDDVVLLPFEAAREDTEARYSDEFDRAFASTFVSYYMGRDARKEYLDERPRFAPFTIAAPQVLQYNVDQVRQLEDDTESFMRQKRAALEAEGELYETLRSELISEADSDVAEDIENGTPSGDLSMDDRNRLTKRYERFEELLEFELFDELEYESVDLFKEILSAARVDEDDFDLLETLDNLEVELEQTNFDEELPDDMGDRRRTVAQALEMEAQRIIERKDLIRYNRSLDDPLLRVNTVDVLVGNYDSRTKPDTKEVFDARDRLNREMRTVDSLAADLERRKDAVESALEGALEDLGEAADDVVASIHELDEARDDLVDEAGTLDAEVAGYAERMGDEDTPDNLDGIQFRYDVDELARRLDDLGVDDHGVSADDIQRANGLVERAVDHKLRGGASGIIGRAKAWIVGSDDQEHRNGYARARSDLDDMSPGVYRLPTWGESPFYVERTTTFAELVAEALDERRRELVGQLVDELIDQLLDRPVGGDGTDDLADPDVEGLDGSAVAALPVVGIETLADVADREELVRVVAGVGAADSAGALRRSVVDALEEHFRGALLEDVESVESEIEEARTDLEERLALYETATTLLSSDDVSSLDEITDGIDEQFEALKEADIRDHDPDYRLIKERQHENIYELMRQNDVADAGVWSDDEVERGEIQQTINEFVHENVGGTTRYLPLRQDTISKSGYEGARSYDGHAMVSVYMSRAWEDGLDFDPCQDLSENYNVGGDYKRVIFNNGAPWEFSVTTFLTGVFLDNLREVYRKRTGYLPTYKDLRSDSVVPRHSYGLGGEDRGPRAPPSDQGMYVRRNELLTVVDEDDEDLQTLINRDDDGEVIDMLFDEGYVDVQAFTADHVFNTRGDDGG